MSTDISVTRRRGKAGGPVRKPEGFDRPLTGEDMPRLVYERYAVVVRHNVKKRGRTGDWRWIIGEWWRLRDAGSALIDWTDDGPMWPLGRVRMAAMDTWYPRPRLVSRGVGHTPNSDWFREHWPMVDDRLAVLLNNARYSVVLRRMA